MLVGKRRPLHLNQNPTNRERNLHPHLTLRRAKNLTMVQISLLQLPTSKQLKCSPMSTKSRLHRAMGRVLIP